MHPMPFLDVLGYPRHLHKTGRSGTAGTPMAVGTRWKRTSEMTLNGCWATDSPAKYQICRYNLEFWYLLRLCPTWVLLAGTSKGIPACPWAESARPVMCCPCPSSRPCRACHRVAHLSYVCRILALFINVIKILHLCVTDTHLEVICKWLKRQWSESVRSRPPRVLPQQLMKCILQKMLT